MSLGAHPRKRIKLTILVVDIPASYNILFNKNFFKDLGDEIKMDWPHTLNPLGNKKVKLELEAKTMFTVLKSHDPRSQILYEEMEVGSYMVLFDDTPIEESLLAVGQHPLQGFMTWFNNLLWIL